MDRDLGPKDATATIVHEYVERSLMVRGWTYGQAHEAASLAESDFRARWPLMHRIDVGRARAFLRSGGWLR